MSPLAFLEQSIGRDKGVLCSDIEHVARQLEKMQKGGASSLHVIADFDMTLTKHWIIDPATGTPTRNLSSHGVLERGPAVSREFAQYTESVAQQYYPYEIDPTIPRERKTHLMVEWWSKAHAAMIKEGITKDTITKQAQHADMTYRDGLLEFVNYLDAQRIPLLIFSAGIADVIEQLLLVGNLDRSNQKVISNHMTFTDGTLTGFKDPLIHVLNKGEQAIHSGEGISSDLKETLRDRKMVILMGDSIGDSHMADGVPHDSLLKLGFCNFGDKDREESFMEAFDVVLLNDQPLDWVNSLLSLIS